MNKDTSILVVDDSHDMLELVRRQLVNLGLNPVVSDNVMDAIELLEQTTFDLLITDLNMPKIGGEQLIKFVAEHVQNLPVLVITGYPSIDSAINVMKLGAMEYLIKPFTAEDLAYAIENILSDIPEPSESLVNENRSSYHGIIGASDKMQELYTTIERTRSNRATILINGESGTGKELVARAVHYGSDFSAAPFISVNCGAIPEQLLESELFGHLKGSFTGAISNRAGFFQAAHGGTLFLDEISNTSLAVQAKLLRAIQEKEVTALGATKSQKIDVRIITATNVNLQELVRQGKFREDLYYRLNVIFLEIPPLRDRKGDIVSLVRYFNQKFSKELSKNKLKFHRNVINSFNNYAWPGNVRELENFIQRLVVMHDDEITMVEIPDYMKSKPAQKEEDDEVLSLKEMERKYIQKVLLSFDNNKSKAAQALGIDRKTLREKLK
ncbi:sigma-54-dependent transcriptional regulator [Crocinitomix algicola]|uniref:sigma-54-dependent transcriptional regulator n=1 Tax=Crocinitomix algicola TaxID=1740263 RepID=UPI00082F83A4|nr:sigma-54 dependent transcriptional regulator [Crocinitomix algicola]